MLLITIVFTFLVAVQCQTNSFMNPDRGWYTQTFRYFGRPNGDALTDWMMQTLRSQGRTITARAYYLENYQLNATLAPAILNEIRADLALLRRHGFRVSMVFAYTDSTTRNPIDAPLEILTSHLQQLRPILLEFEPVVSTFLHGFMGTWGEMYYTSFYKSPANKTALLRAVINAIPASIPVAVRTPDYFDMIPSDIPRDRIGLYDHCALADAGDTGTFPGVTTPSIDAITSRMATRFLNIGTSAETCPGASSDANSPPEVRNIISCSWAMRHFAAIRLMQLNDAWYKPIIDGFRTQGCFNNITERLGYAPALVRASAQAVTIRNNGWSKPPRNNQTFAYIVPQSQMTGNTSQVAYRIPLGWDIRTLSVNNETTFPMTLTGTGQIVLNAIHEVLIGIETGGPSDVAYRILFNQPWGPRLNRIGVTLPAGTRLAATAVQTSI